MRYIFLYFIEHPLKSLSANFNIWVILGLICFDHVCFLKTESYFLIFFIPNDFRLYAGHGHTAKTLDFVLFFQRMLVFLLLQTFNLFGLKLQPLSHEPKALTAPEFSDL